MKTVLIGFSRPKNKIFPIFSWIIRLVEWSPFSHVLVRWPVWEGPMICYQASGTQVNAVGEFYFDEHIDMISEFEIEVQDPDYIEARNFVLINLGKPYSLRSAFGILLQKIGLYDENPWADGDASYVCSEFIGRLLRPILKDDLGLDIESAGPKDIHRRLMQLCRISGSPVKIVKGTQ